MDSVLKKDLSKVPAVTLGFWIVKILATTLGETGGDALSMTLSLGYLVSSLIFAGIFAVAVAVQIRARAFHPYIYWLTIVATTTLGTTMADFADRSLGVGYTGGSALLFALLIISLAVWRRTLGTVAVDSIVTAKAEMFYWVTILFSQTLGTALGDWMADSNGFGYERAALVFGAGLAVIAALYFSKKVSHTALFWAAFILTRPLGATLGDLIDKPIEHGGHNIGRFWASAALALFMIALVHFLPQKTDNRPGREKPA